MIIDDGSGKGFSAKVDECLRVHTHAFTICADTSATINGDVFDICTGIITLTNAAESGLLYIKNNENDDLIISLQFVNLGTSTNGVGESTVTFYLSPTTGTLIACGCCLTALNRRIGASCTLTADILKGAQGRTITNGNAITFPSTGFASNSPFVMPKGSTFAVSVTPPTSNTSMPVAVGLFVIKNATKYGND